MCIFRMIKDLKTFNECGSFFIQVNFLIILLDNLPFWCMFRITKIKKYAGMAALVERNV